MFCNRCGKEIDDNASFCSHCGKRVGQNDMYCARCGQPVEKNAKFCTHCGCPLGEDNNDARRTYGYAFYENPESTIKVRPKSQLYVLFVFACIFAFVFQPASMLMSMIGISIGLSRGDNGMVKRFSIVMLAVSVMCVLGITYSIFA